MVQYYLYRLEHGVCAAQQRAADQRMGELVADLADGRRALAHSLRRGLGTLKAVARLNRTGEQARVVTALPGQ